MLSCRPSVAHPMATRGADGVSDARFALTMTVRNNAGTIGACLASLLPQLGDDGELAIVDAVSTDATLAEIRRAVGDRPNVTVVSEPCNRGQGRNRAIALTRAPIVVTQLDADNQYAPGVVRDAAQALTSDASVSVLNLVGRDDPNPSSTRFFVWRRDALERARGYPNVQYAEELGLVLRAFRSGLRFRRRMVPRLATDLKVRPAGHGSSLTAWRRGHVALRASKKFALLGFRFGEFVRYLGLTRRTYPRYVAGVGLAAVGYVEFVAAGRTDAFLRDGLGETPEQVAESTSNPEWPTRR
jgi:glycosyltransferase involved in cell wall biosynthesis